ncbi:glycosyltransferase family 4 protein [Hwangdonia sp.]|uniref:glycosyltransferase family 4 protein n=1 Tax=Hwangdonia sp. TaxID=1883432 RepID=UPI003AB40E3F
MRKKILRITTVPMSLASLLKGQLKFMSDYFEIIGVSSAGDGFLEDISSRENIKTIPVEMTRKITPLKDLAAVYKLYKIFKKEQPFIVHSHTPKAGTLSMIAARLANVPHRLHTIAGLPLVEATGLKRILLNSVEKITYQCATKIYPNSYGLVDIILENKFTNNNKLKVLGNGSSNGIDTTHFNPKLYNKEFKTKLRCDLNIAETDYVFIYVGRLVKDKGVNELINAFDIISNEFENVKLLLVGWYENELDPLLPETVNLIKSSSNIVTTGWVSDVRPYFAISDTLVFASYREGFPNVVLQAAAMELFSIVTDINGCNEVIEDNENGFIIPTKNYKSIYEKMAFVLNNKDLTTQMGLKSRARIISNYEQKLVWSAILEEYNRLN